MSKEERRLSQNLKTFNQEMTDRLNELSPKEQQQYLEGIIHTLNAMTRLAIPAEVSPFGREQFIEATKAWAYSETSHRGLDDQKHMEKMVNSDWRHVFTCYKLARILSCILDMPLSMDQEFKFENMATLASRLTSKFSSPSKD